MCAGVLMKVSAAHLCHVEPQADGLALLQERVELLAVKKIVKVTPQSFKNIVRKLHLLVVPARQSVGAPVQQHLHVKRIKTEYMVDMYMLLSNNSKQTI